MKKLITLTVCLCSIGIFNIYADNVGICTAPNIDNGKTISTTVYITQGKTAIEADSPQGRFRTIKNAQNVYIVIDAQKLCLQSPVPYEDIIPGTKTMTNSDGSKVHCTWSERTVPASIYECPAGYAKRLPSGN